MLLTDGHEDLVDVHGSLGRCLHEQQAVVLSVGLGILAEGTGAVLGLNPGPNVPSMQTWASSWPAWARGVPLASGTGRGGPHTPLHP